MGKDTPFIMEGDGTIALLLYFTPEHYNTSKKFRERFKKIKPGTIHEKLTI